MTSEDRPPPRGEDAWKATKQRIAKRNEAAYGLDALEIPQVGTDRNGLQRQEEDHDGKAAA